MRLFELCAADEELRFSPFVWRARLALAHKGLDYQRIPTHFHDKSPFAASGSQTVPVLEDKGTWVSDSWNIACYLEDSYPERPTLFGGEPGRPEARFITLWGDRVALAGLFPIYAAEVCDLLDEPDRSYFRESRSKRVGRDIYELRETREERVEPFRASLAPLRALLEEQPFICGESPAWADYTVVSGFLWARCCSRFETLAPDDPIHAWRERMLDLHGGLARKEKCAA